MAAIALHISKRASSAGQAAWEVRSKYNEMSRRRARRHKSKIWRIPAWGQPKFGNELEITNHRYHKELVREVSSKCGREGAEGNGARHISASRYAYLYNWYYIFILPIITPEWYQNCAA